MRNCFRNSWTYPCLRKRRCDKDLLQKVNKTLRAWVRWNLLIPCLRDCVQLFTVSLSKQNWAAREIPWLTAASYHERHCQCGHIQLIMVSWPTEMELVDMCLLAASLPLLCSFVLCQGFQGVNQVSLIIRGKEVICLFSLSWLRWPLVQSLSYFAKEWSDFSCTHQLVLSEVVSLLLHASCTLIPSAAIP